MTFIFRIEENGYELRCWNEVDEEIGELLVESWDLHQIHNYLTNNHFHILYSKLERAEKELEDRGFVIFGEKEKSKFYKELTLI
ncbi:MAG: hypothetical protein ACOCRO_03640 [Halanaerobiales bacterium]